MKSNICFLKCRVTPSQRTSATPYNVWAAVEKTKPGGKIISAYCSCTAGLLGSCNHVTAMLFRVEAAVSTGVTKASCTSKLCKWNVPTKSKHVFDMKTIREIAFTKSTYKRRNDESSKVDNAAYAQFTPDESPELDDMNFMRQKIYDQIKDHVPQSRFVEVMESKKKSKSILCDQSSNHDDHNIILKAEKFAYNFDISLENNVNSFTNSLQIDQNDINNIYARTKEQSQTILWQNLRKGRITASKFHNVFTRINSINKDCSQNPDCLIKELIERKQFETLATKHGIAMEVHALEKFKKVMNLSHTKCKFVSSGMVIDDQYPFLSVSPDLEGSCQCCGEFSVEVKCPFSICETIPTAENLSYLQEVEVSGSNCFKLKKSHGYYTQIQGQLAITKKKFAWFFVFSHHGYHIERIDFDLNH